MNNASNPIRILVALFGMCLVLFGFCLLIKVITLPIPPLWISAILMIIGLTMLGPSEPKLQIIFGVLLFGSGTFMALRAINIITRPWVQYGLGGLLVIGGVILVTYSVMGGTPKHTGPDTQKIDTV